MITFFAVLPAATLVVAIVSIIQFAMLLFRNPFRPAWLRRDGVVVAASLLITTAISMGLGVMLSASVGAGLGFSQAIGLTLLVAVGAGYTVLRLFDIRERLRRADAGQSPM